MTDEAENAPVHAGCEPVGSTSQSSRAAESQHAASRNLGSDSSRPESPARRLATGRSVTAPPGAASGASLPCCGVPQQDLGKEKSVRFLRRGIGGNGVRKSYTPCPEGSMARLHRPRRRTHRIPDVDDRPRIPPRGRPTPGGWSRRPRPRTVRDRRARRSRRSRSRRVVGAATQRPSTDGPPPRTECVSTEAASSRAAFGARRDSVRGGSEKRPRMVGGFTSARHPEASTRRRTAVLVD